MGYARNVRRLLVALAVLIPATAHGQSGPRWDPGLVLARRTAQHPGRARALFRGARDEGVGVVLRFASSPGDAVFRDLERAGAVLPRGRSGEVITVGSMVGAFVPWRALDRVARVSGLVRIALGRPPGQRAPMDVSVREVGALRAWSRRDDVGQALTGRGVLVADMDTAVDIHHPMFFFADGGTFEWLDVDGDGAFTSGVDAADMDRDGSADPEETLRLQDARRNGVAADGRLHAGEDWLWVDADENGRRDYGLEGGYGETDPCFGEILLVADDADLDDVLDVGETLTALGSSKVVGIYEFPGRTFLRGQNMLEADLSDDSHGTGVTSILAGGWARTDRRFAGIAPDAEIVVATRAGGDSGVVVTAPWAVELGADVVLYEYGAIAGRFLDGSDEDDLVVDELAGLGVPQITPTGNWGDADKTLRTWIEPAARMDGVFHIPQDWHVGMTYVTLRWRRPEVPLDGAITSPSGIVLPLAPETDTNVDGLRITVSEDVSERGTLARSIIVFRADEGDLEVGDWSLSVTNPDLDAVELWGTIVDDVSGFGGGARFTLFADRDASAASPSTADRAIAVGSYSTRTSFGGDRIGQLSGFSGRGPRIDGAAIVDVAAPGDFDVLWAQSRRGRDDWGFFTMGGGTSAAGPHVAGAAALLVQARPDATPDEIEAALRAGASVDDFVGDIPNLTWGAGKLRISAALDALGPAPPPPDPDGGVDAGPDAGPDAGVDAGADAAADASTASDDGSGCGCRATSSSGAATLPCICALALALLASRRRA